MSLDSVTRIDDYFKTSITDVLGIETIFEDENKGQFEPGGGMFIKMWVEPSFDDLTGNSIPNKLYTERGLVVIQIFTIKGQGTKNLYALESVGTSIRDAFRDKFLDSDGTQEGAIYFEDISTRQTIEIGRQNSPQGRGSSFNGVWKRKDIFVNYQKSYNVEMFITPVNTAIPVVTGDVAVDDLLTTTTGTWDNGPTSFTYRWLRDDVVISGATSQTYTIVSADEETTIKSEVTAINPGGSSLPAESVGTAIPSGIIQRYLTTLDQALTQHYELDSIVELTGDFELEMDARTTVSNQGTLIGTSSNDYGMYISSLEAIIVLMNGANLNSGNSVFEKGPLNKIGLTRVGSLVTLLYNGVPVDTGNTTAPFDVKRMGLWNDLLSQFDGIISNVKIREGVGNTLIHSWDLDEDFSGTSTAVDSVGSNDATAQNIVASEHFTLDDTVSPNTWTSDDELTVIEIAEQA